MPANRPVWFATFTLVVFCLGGLAGYRIGGHLPPFGPGPGLFAGRGGPGGPGAPGGPGRGAPPPFGRGRGGPPGLPPRILQDLISELQLDAAQQDQVKKTLDDHRDRLEAVHREARERFEKEQSDLRGAIRAVLKPEQQTRFDKFLDRRP
jgi:Spy/CpxP family protein refolding chaperone